MKRNRIFSLLLDRILDKPGTDIGIDGVETARDLGSREFNILRLEDLRKDLVLSSGQTNSSSASQERCSGLAEKTIWRIRKPGPHIPLPASEEASHSAGAFPAYRSPALVKIGSKSEERTNLGSSTGGRCRETHCCNKSKACTCIFFPLRRNINSDNFCRAKRNVRTAISPWVEGESPRTFRSLKGASTPTPHTNFQPGTTIPADRTLSIGTI